MIHMWMNSKVQRVAVTFNQTMLHNIILLALILLYQMDHCFNQQVDYIVLSNKNKFKVSKRIYFSVPGT